MAFDLEAAPVSAEQLLDASGDVVSTYSTMATWKRAMPLDVPICEDLWISSVAGTDGDGNPHPVVLDLVDAAGHALGTYPDAESVLHAHDVASIVSANLLSTARLGEWRVQFRLADGPDPSVTAIVTCHNLARAISAMDGADVVRGWGFTQSSPPIDDGPWVQAFADVMGGE